MSETTKHSHVPIFDIDTYVHRSTEERRQEVVSGKIKQPMNAFMLYRMAYQNRAKELCKQEHSISQVSQVCGNSWRLEPDHVRAQFTEWAKINRKNHYKAHPSYKFECSRRNKRNAVATKCERDGDDDRNVNLTNDPDKGLSKPMHKMGTLLDSAEYSQHKLSAFQARNPDKPIPFTYDGSAAARGHCYLTTQTSDNAFGHIMYKIPSPLTTNFSHGAVDEYCPPLQTQQFHQLFQQPKVQHSPAATSFPQHVKYPHPMDPAAWHAWPVVGGQQLDDVNERTMAAFESQYDVAGDEFGNDAILEPLQEVKISKQEWWPESGCGFSQHIFGFDWYEL
jgi:hypothetical protein